ncbi:MAG TPA: phosphatase PAP2 family protein [Blastococcus sp.]
MAARPAGRAAVGRGDPRGRGARPSFVSGHAATSTAPAAGAWPWLGPRGHRAVTLLVVVICLTRMYVGAHLPLDVVGGAGLGLAIAGVLRLPASP